jgi:hypothetical protein
MMSVFGTRDPRCNEPPVPWRKKKRRMDGGRSCGAAVILALSFLMSVPGSLRAAFSGLSADNLVPGGLGGVAKADRALTQTVNPAGLSRLPQAEASFLYSEPFTGLSNGAVQQGGAALAFPLGSRWSMGMGLHAFNGADLLREEEGTLSVAARIGGRLAVGVGANYLLHSYAVPEDVRLKDDPALVGRRSRGAVSADAGALLRAARFLDLGASVRHINRPDVGLYTEDRVPLEARGGALIRGGRLGLSLEALWRDAGKNVAQGRVLSWSAGLEWAPVSRIALRTGVAGGALNVGVGIGLKSLVLDYSFGLVRGLDKDGGMGHRAAVSYRFGKARRVR